jgi:hypothetical protein
VKNNNDTDVKRAILAGVQAIWQAGCVYELRALKTRLRPGTDYRTTRSGYFDAPEKLAQAAYELDRQELAPGIYMTVNPVKPELLARAANRVETNAQHTTSDAEIDRRLILPVDIDVQGPSGISSTDADHNAAIELAYTIANALVDQDWPVPTIVDSGNGAHLLFAVDLPNDDESMGLVKATLKALAARYDTAALNIDQGVYNAARILKIPGTTARKGDSIPDRPHRRSRILMPGSGEVQVQW